MRKLTLLLALSLLLVGMVPAIASAAPAVFSETFDVDPVISATPASGVWYTDRYAPAVFAKAWFQNDSRLKMSLSSADSSETRPPAFRNPFYNTQGRVFDIALAPVATTQMWVGSDSATNQRRMGLWVTPVNGAGDVLGWPSIEFANRPNPSAYDDPPNSGSTYVGFRVWDNFGWHNVSMPVSYDKWYSLRIQQNADSLSYFIDNRLVYTSSFADDTDLAGSVGFDTVMLEAYNFGADYDTYFDNMRAAAVETYEITAVAGPEGWISPEGSALMNYGESATYDVRAFSGYHIADTIIDGVSVGASSTVTFSNVSADHRISAIFARDTTAVIRTTLGLTASNVTPEYGSAVTLTAALQGSAGGAANQAVFFERQSGASWISVGCALTDGSGVAAVSTSPYGNAKTTYRARFGGTSEYALSTSAEAVVTPHHYITKGNAPKTMYKRKAKTVTGYLKSRHASGTKTVRIYRYKKNSKGVYVKYDHVHATIGNYSTYSKYSRSLSFPSAGKWRIRAYMPADSLHAAKFSSYDYVTVK